MPMATRNIIVVIYIYSCAHYTGGFLPTVYIKSNTMIEGKGMQQNHIK